MSAGAGGSLPLEYAGVRFLFLGVSLPFRGFLMGVTIGEVSVEAVGDWAVDVAAESSLKVEVLGAMASLPFFSII